MSVATITRHGEKFALVPLDKYRRLVGEAELPLLAPLDADGTGDALAYARALIARRLHSDRRAARLTQQQLADLSGVRQETISRIESGKHTATVRIMDKLNKAIQKAASRRHGRG